ncbi:PREDICTED: uncharacterized protein LOC108360592 [Rhagoletis zephyria]|uniref:uncharacterized protein LOC108360592 n=1 Tax=Rhagoletis zephyria TaxID=28612 RepID=UPI00081133C1|nr:PREDICTED: uncharacterized protein LOC108360592 [Rhagoletis zephyria]XP_036340835.1 uncharacterized protein LOC118750216 [Rhagoletis pomonella]
MSPLKVRDSALKAIKRYLQSSKSDELSVDVEVVSTYLQLLEEQWGRFCEAQQEVELSCGEENVEMEEQSRIQGEEWYAIAKANFKRLTAPLKIPTPQATQTTPAPVPLPKLQLPSFSGDPTEWLTFHDAFCSLVNSNGEALELVSCLAVSDSNYSEAWDLLTSRYKVMRVIVDSHIKALTSNEKAAKDSAKAIKHVLNLTLQHVGALRALGRPVEFWDDWLVHLTVSKLAYETRKQWELSLVADDLPTFAAPRDFLETRTRSLEMVPAVPHNARTTAKNVLHTTCGQTEPQSQASSDSAKAAACTYCKGEHRIYSCSKFSQLDAKPKLTTIKAQGASLNCLSKGMSSQNLAVHHHVAYANVDITRYCTLALTTKPDKP